ncbi:MAG: hypothetical protein KAS23_06230 [Anaerohalosphaera sp.]|nr:hypothetical protein [Anaerohalosphaera sp.]
MAQTQTPAKIDSIAITHADHNRLSFRLFLRNSWKYMLASTVSKTTVINAAK